MAVVEQVKEFESLAEVLEDLDALGIQGIHRYRAVNQYLSLKARFNDTPISGTFELTPLCNLDCRMCYVHLNANQLKPSERLLTVAEWKSIAKQCVDAGMMYVTLTGGECLTYPQFKELYLYITTLGIQPDVMTNGRLLRKCAFAAIVTAVSVMPFAILASVFPVHGLITRASSSILGPSGSASTML